MTRNYRHSKLCCAVAAISSAYLLVLSSNQLVGVEASHYNNNEKKNKYYLDDYYDAYDYDKDKDDDRKHLNDHIAYHYYTVPVETPTSVEVPPSVETAWVTTNIDATYTQTITVPGRNEAPGNDTEQRLNKALDQCTWDGSDNITRTIRYFNVIVFGDYNAQNAQEIWGPLGVDGNLLGTDFDLNTHYPSSVCSDLDTNPLRNYGLVVHGAVDITNDALVHGAGFLDGGGTTDHVSVVEPGCPLNEGTTGQFDFGAMHNAYLVASEELASFPPNMVLDPSDQLTIDESNSVAAGTENYYVMALDTCTVFDGSCADLWPDRMSYPDRILLGSGNWNGLANGRVFPTDKTIVLNIPVDNGATIYVRTRRPHAGGFNACRTIFNFYPVDSDGNYEPNGSFTLHRENDGELQGMILAPLGHIEDAPTGTFAGQVIGLDYYWQDGNSGLIRDFSATGCDINYTGCLPLVPNEEVIEICNRPSNQVKITPIIALSTTTLVTSTIDTATTTETTTETEVGTTTTTAATTETQTETSITTTTETQGSIGTITVLTNTDTTTTTNLVVSTETGVTTTTETVGNEGGVTTITETSEHTTTTTQTIPGEEPSVDDRDFTRTTVTTVQTATVSIPLTTIHDLSTVTTTEQHTVTENGGRETVYIPIKVPVWEDDYDKNDHGGGSHHYGKEKDRHWHKSGWKKHSDKGGEKKWSHKKDYD
ncbi:hypothetical protein BDB00DRAFT_897273 [Zychaea mexicana]|uniref:uncharacterized protein n=1 Tax=Zychaea mexicana TaxID=64656 RepID=UPI0022FE53EE|nr:uncharacterized protein BDB00DRAFT_897273 [Zychaea mexicana]KAI9495601.1 hypothetical protein BDB00DRAFT_897273 [Zychaea mexicana]